MRETFLPFSRPSIGEEEIEEVTASLQSGWLTTGPKVLDFEAAFKDYVGCGYAVSFSSATAGLHVALLACGIGPGDEVITTPLTFAATLNVIVLTGAKPVLADIDPKTLNIDPAEIQKKITQRTRAIMPVHFAGQPCDMDTILSIAEKHNLRIIEDAAHAVGTEYKGRRIGSLPTVSVFSFHPTKNITCGEGGMLCTHEEEIAEKAVLYRSHGMTKGAWNRYAARGNPHYDILLPGYKYNMMDIQAGIGIHQLRKLDKFIARRTYLAERYNRALAGTEGIILPPRAQYPMRHAWHIYTPLINIDRLTISRDEFMAKMREYNIGTALHYQAIHLHTYYRAQFGFKRGDFPDAEYVSDRIVSLPLFPDLAESDQDEVIDAVQAICRECRA